MEVRRLSSKAEEQRLAGAVKEELASVVPFSFLSLGTQHKPGTW